MEKKTPKGLKELSGMSVNRVMRMYNLKEECENMDLPELIVNLRKCIAFHLDPYNLGDECKTTFLINKLIEYASQDKWISVEERLPEDSKDHFVYMVHVDDLPEDEPTKEVAKYYQIRKKWDVLCGWKVIKWLDESNQSKTDIIDEEHETNFEKNIKNALKKIEAKNSGGVTLEKSFYDGKKYEELQKQLGQTKQPSSVDEEELWQVMESYWRDIISDKPFIERVKFREEIRSKFSITRKQ